MTSSGYASFKGVTTLKTRSLFQFMVLCLAAAACVGCSSFQSRRLVEKTSYGIMDTDVTIKAYGRDAEAAVDAAFEEIKRLDALLSAHDSGSEIWAVNQNAGIDPVEVSPDTMYVVERALYFAQITDGAFDPTILPVMSLWGFGTPAASVPKPAELQDALKLVDYKKIYVNSDDGTVFVSEYGMGLDLGGIAKGYAVDKMAQVMRDKNVSSFLINAGGNTLTSGTKPDGSLWRVAVTDPSNPEDFIGVMPSKNLAIVGSGDYQRFFVEDGVKYHHIIDPKTGYPVRGIHGTAVFLPSSTDADALSTSLFVLGPDAGEEILTKFENLGVIYVVEDGNMILQGLVDDFVFQ